MTAALNCQILTTFDAPGLLDEWRILCAAAELTVFASPEWHQCWQRHYGAQGDLLLLTVRAAGQLVGLAPLLRQSRPLRGLPARVVRFAENGHSLHNQWLLHPLWRHEALDVLLEKLWELRPQWDLLEFKNLPCDCPVTATLRRRLDERGLEWAERPALSSPYLNLDRSWDTFHAGCSTRTRKTQRNLLNSLRRAGRVDLLRLRSLAEYLHWREALLEVASHSWTHQAGDSLASPLNLGFFDDLAASAAERGWLDLWLLTLDSRAIAFEYHLRYHQRVHALRACFHQEFAGLSPGACLDRLVVERLFGEAGELGEYDLGGSCDIYKQRWSPSVRRHTLIHVFQPTARSRLLQGFEYRLVPLARRGRDWLRGVSDREVRP